MEQEVVEMVKRAKAGDKEMLIQLIMRQKQDYYRLAYVYMKNHDINDNYDKLMDGTIIHKRTLRFLGAGEDFELYVQRMTYAKNYNKIIYIPVN